MANVLNQRHARLHNQGWSEVHNKLRCFCWNLRLETYASTSVCFNPTSNLKTRKICFNQRHVFNQRRASVNLRPALILKPKPSADPRGPSSLNHKMLLNHKHNNMCYSTTTSYSTQSMFLTTTCYLTTSTRCCLGFMVFMVYGLGSKDTTQPQAQDVVLCNFVARFDATRPGLACYTIQESDSCVNS